MFNNKIGWIVHCASSYAYLYYFIIGQLKIFISIFQGSITQNLRDKLNFSIKSFKGYAAKKIELINCEFLRSYLKDQQEFFRRFFFEGQKN